MSKRRPMFRLGVVAVVSAVTMSMLAPSGAAAAPTAQGDATATSTTSSTVGSDAATPASPIIVPGTPAAPGPAAPATRSRLGPVNPPPAGVSALPAAAVPAPPSSARPKLALRPADGTRSMVQEDLNCMPYAYGGPVGFGFDAYLEEVVNFSVVGGVDCNFYVDSISGDIGAVDRSPDYNGQGFNGIWLSDSGIFGSGYGASNSAPFTAQARLYNGARWAEPILTLYLAAPYGQVWDYCGLVPGMYYRACDGLGTSLLYIQLGAFGQPTGLTQACRNLSYPLDAEQSRLLTLSGGTPASTQILNTIPSLRNLVTGFKQALCSTSVAGADTFLATRGQQLWTEAVNQAKNAATNNDDRPLYWARLSMTTAVHQWKPPPGTDIGDSARHRFERIVDWAARGMNSHSFAPGAAKKVFVSGFDPFELDGGWIMRGNPSAAAVLGLDNTTVAGAEIQVVIFPVRYRDFTFPGVYTDVNDGIVETALRPHLDAGSQRADLITTVSQGGARFDLEYYNGRNRGGHPDNRNETGVTGPTPFEPPYNEPAGAPRREFAESTLPFGAMLPFNSASGYGFEVAINYSVWEQAVRSQSPAVPRDAYYSPGWIAVAGGGGDFLSNEVAYRLTELRFRLGSPTRAGHVHTPVLNEFPPPLSSATVTARRTSIVTQYRAMLGGAITGGPPYCGEASCGPVQAAYISHFTGLGCTGKESYYTPYFFFDGIRRSWDGNGVVGTTLATTTHRSWKGSDGQCHDSWPSGNELSGFVRVYR